MNNFNQKYKQHEEILILEELIKTMKITWLAKTKVLNFLKSYTHSEIRSWKFINKKFVIKDKFFLD